ncbi:sigma-70 non-essential region-containing protein [Streptomyces sp. NPDC059697]|uniref:sigma-70 non-essential region-containing protein n=1 Tax=Streptomyces sp. NPDC059697 TaxID=3346912 RepID=UPI00143E70C7|nr:sigma-70 non-essential region-containing protein [Streptomyces sp. S1D4-11]QIY98418.1 sigma-70 non-essential region-containing protein [Streptomyces sp. S1D4-11]
MGTKTVDEAVDANGTEAKSDEETVNVTKTDEAPDAEVEETGNAEAEDAEDQDDLDAEALEGEDAPEAEKGTPGVGQGAAAVVSAGLGVVSLTGSWVATVAAARETLVGQLGTSSTASVAKQVKEVYGDAWATTALVGGLFALAALIVGVVVLVRPAFGAPGKPQAAWIKSVAWAGVSLGVIGLVLAVAKYSDIILGLPSTS